MDDTKFAVVFVFCFFLKDDWPKPRQRSVPLHDRLVPEFKLWVKDVQSITAGFISRGMARLNSTKDKKLLLIKGCRMVCQIWNISSRLKTAKTNQSKAFPLPLLEYLSLQHVSNWQQTHSDKLPIPGQCVEDVQLVVALSLPQATVYEDGFRVWVIGRRVSSSTGWHRSRSRGVHGKPEVIVWEEVKKRKMWRKKTKKTKKNTCECAQCATILWLSSSFFRL